MSDSGLNELLQTVLGGDVALAGLLGATAGDTKLYPVSQLGQAVLPAVGYALWGSKSDVGHPINRDMLDLTIQGRSEAEVRAIANQIEVLLDRQRFAGNGRVVHLAKKEYEHDDFHPDVLQFFRDARYALTVT